ncbi:MAG: AGE family epimerase/isomerase [Oscillospiraceae bacterium]|nr:AGE family epimerase/isomerase [Oscillospiraceae bacterium]
MMNSKWKTPILLISAVIIVGAILIAILISINVHTPCGLADNDGYTDITNELGEVKRVPNTTNITEETTTMANITDITFDKTSAYYQYADDAQANLLKNYWNDNGNIFFDKYPNSTSGGLNYWWMAHAIDVLTDAYIRTGDEKYKEYADKVLTTVVKKNGGKIINGYYDDMEWMALALLRLYDITGERKYISYVEDLWADITTGWNDTMGGGIAWRKEQRDYKNTPANAPAAILAARLYNTTGNEVYLTWAKKIFAFEDENLIDRQTGQVWDGINRQGDGKIDKDWCFTYCHGVYIGAAVELYKITQDRSYLDKAVKTAGFALDKFVKNGCFADEGAGDGGLFKGILIRYLAELYEVKPDFILIKDTLNNNVDILRSQGTNSGGLYGRLWSKAPKDKTSVDLTVQLSGVMLYETAAVVNSIK